MQLPRTARSRFAAALLAFGLLLAAAALLTLPGARAGHDRAAAARHEAAGLLARLGHTAPAAAGAGAGAARVPAPSDALVEAARRALSGATGPLTPRVAARRSDHEDPESATAAGITVEPIGLPAAAGLLEALASDPALPGLTADRLRLVAPAPGRWRLELSASVPAP